MVCSFAAFSLARLLPGFPLSGATGYSGAREGSYADVECWGACRRALFPFLDHPLSATTKTRWPLSWIRNIARIRWRSLSTH
jgi:hypothetical protein